jgi:hypothetical protein
MRLRLTALVVGLTFVGLTAAQESTSVALKSGEQFSGQLVDLGAPGFTFEVNGQKRVVPKNDVVSINFEGGQDANKPSQIDNLSAGQSAIVLKSGEVVVGEFYDIGGTEPLRLTFRTSGGEREVSSNDVRAIWVSKPAAGTASTQPADIGGQTVAVQARQRWTPTNITVKRGQTVRFQADGTVTVNTRSRVQADPGGNTSINNRENPVPTAPTGALVARIGIPGRGGSGAAFLVGNQDSVTMPADGPLLLGVNDTELDDNTGTFQVKVAPQE